MYCVYYNTVICDFVKKTMYMGIYAGFSSKEKNIEVNSKKQIVRNGSV